MSFLNNALTLANNGFHVFPCKPNSKLPAIKDFTNQATRDPEKIKSWWIDPILEIEKDFNIGISTSSYGENEALLAVDVDTKKDGDETIIKLEIEGKELPHTFTQITPTDGRHIVYRVPSPVKQGTDVLGKGVDIRSKGGYIVGSGSSIEGKEYKIESEVFVNEAPKWLVEACGLPVKKDKESQAPTKQVNQNAATLRAIDYLENHAMTAIEGQGGDQATFIVACKVKDFGVDEVTALEIMDKHWNYRCSPPWHVDELEKKIANAYQYGVEPVGSDAPEAQFEPVEVDNSPEMLSYLEQMNLEYALIYMEGNHFILHETIDEKGRPKRTFLTEQTFKRRFSPFLLEKKATYATVWLDWRGRREYKGVCFAPEREARNGYYNLWRGFTCLSLAYNEGTIEQRKGFDMFISHARENICNGDENLFQWVMGYFAHMVQRPYERPLTTLVFRGGKGTGKNALVDRIGALLGTGHYLVAHDGRYLTSNFNAHFDSCLCLVLDEAFWSGDKNAEGKLKGLTTAPEIMIERKGKEPYTVDNLVRLIIIGNEEWLVPASNDERRYAVYDVGDGRKQDRKFFHEMRVLMDEKGGNRILLDYLKNIDLSKVDVNAAPATEALLDQKLESLEPFQQWWLEKLNEGEIGDFGWPEFIEKEYLRASFVRYCQLRQIRSRLPSDRVFTVNLKKICKRISSHRISKDDGLRKSSYALPNLVEARNSWDEFIGQKTKWEEV